MRAVLFLAALGSLLAAAPTAAREPLPDLEIVADSELAEQRGGFRHQGLEIRLGAELRSYLGDALVVQTNVTWSASGAEFSRVVSGALTPAAASDLQAGIMAGGSLNFRVGEDQVFLANNGQTAFAQRTDGTLQNIVVNTASGVAIRQEVDAKLDIDNFQPFQAGILAERIGRDVAGMIQSAPGSRGD